MDARREHLANARRYLWTGAFGVVLLVSLYAEPKNAAYLDEACGLVAEVERVLGRPRGMRIGEAEDRQGQYFHYLAMWLFALGVLARHVPGYRQKGSRLIARSSPGLVITEDLGIGMMLWMTQFSPHEEWAVTQRSRCLAMLEQMWFPDGYSCREPALRDVKCACTTSHFPGYLLRS